MITTESKDINLNSLDLINQYERLVFKTINIIEIFTIIIKL
jgi:hypothetical protein